MLIGPDTIYWAIYSVGHRSMSQACCFYLSSVALIHKSHSTMLLFQFASILCLFSAVISASPVAKAISIRSSLIDGRRSVNPNATLIAELPPIIPPDVTLNQALAGLPATLPADPLSRMILYAQTFHQENSTAPLSLLPLAQTQSRATHVIIASISRSCFVPTQ